MQTLDIISVNLWNILISLLNLVLIFLIVKKFLFQPVRKLLDERQAAIDGRYAAADRAVAEAEESRLTWEQKRRTADEEAAAILDTATATAKRRAGEIVAEAERSADGIRRRAEEDAVLTRKKATEGIKTEIVEVSTAIAEKLLAREVNAADHRALIDSFIEGIGDGDDGRQ